MNRQAIATLLLRISLAASLLSAVASRVDLWGIHSSGWDNFLQYTAQVNSFLPKQVVPLLAVISTILESSFGLMLLTGFKTKFAAIGAALLTLLFALAMSVSFGIKEPLDYSVFAFSAGALLLSTAAEYPWSLDKIITKNKQ